MQILDCLKKVGRLCLQNIFVYLWKVFCICLLCMETQQLKSKYAIIYYLGNMVINLTKKTNAVVWIIVNNYLCPSCRHGLLLEVDDGDNFTSISNLHLKEYIYYIHTNASEYSYFKKFVHSKTVMHGQKCTSKVNCIGNYATPMFCITNIYYISICCSLKSTTYYCFLNIITIVHLTDY